tara:strand:- start:174 stop:605 length:432 start_codon:yes stop_codon:yes gene_type:complete
MTSNSTLNGPLYEPESTTTYDFQSQPRLSLVPIGQKSINNKRRGDIAEDDVIREAALRGAEVFKNHFTTGPADLILFDIERTPTTVVLDVKSTVKKTKGDQYGYGCKGRPHKEGITNVLYHTKTGKVRWLRNHIPEGWEDFWD